ncbi:MAG: L,D-transpeptidase family protein [Cyclobacteriaceae bacterium]|nr:L,D-transpeptidase family protein [Cyclobacteriaceae bacterium]
MKSKFSIFNKIWIALTVVHFISVSVYAQNKDALLKEIIQATALSKSTLVIGNEEVVSRVEVITFYQGNHYKVAWKKAQNIQSLIRSVQTAYAEGLNPQEYHLAALERLSLTWKSADEDVAFDILLTDAFLTYAHHLLSGKLDPTIFYGREWEADKRSSDLKLLLQDALREQSIEESLNQLKPAYAGYRNLKRALNFYRTVEAAGGWMPIPEGKIVKPGDIDDRMPLIRKRLLESLQTPFTIALESVEYDSMLAIVVKNFQQQHGIKNDGVIGKSTFKAMNLSVKDYIKAIIINLERYRWMPQQLGSNYVLINIAGYSLEVWEDDSVVLAMNVIVGRPERRTPTLSSSLKYLIVNPTWTVPPTILREDVLPAVRKNPEYLKQNNLRLFTREGVEVEETQVQLSKFTERNFPYIIRQDPGDYNSLGLIKFHFPNHHSIFLHDTNHRALFSESYRARSSGCIRLEKPFALARYVLHDDRLLRKMDAVVNSGKTETFIIKKPVPIHIFYFTAFADRHGRLDLREDIYKWDEVVWKNLNNYVLGL